MLASWYNKTAHLASKEKLIVRALPPWLGAIFMEYALLVHPFQAVMANAFLGEESGQLCYQHLFSMMGKELETTFISGALQKAWKGVCTDTVPQFGVKAHRHIFIGFMRALIKTADGRPLYKENDDEEEDGGDHIADLQAGHGTAIGDRHYAIEIGRLSTLSTDKVAAFMHISRAWQMASGTLYLNGERPAEVGQHFCYPSTV